MSYLRNLSLRKQGAGIQRGCEIYLSPLLDSSFRWNDRKKLSELLRRFAPRDDKVILFCRMHFYLQVIIIIKRQNTIPNPLTSGGIICILGCGGIVRRNIIHRVRRLGKRTRCIGFLRNIRSLSSPTDVSKRPIETTRSISTRKPPHHYLPGFPLARE